MIGVARSEEHETGVVYGASSNSHPRFIELLLPTWTTRDGEQGIMSIGKYVSRSIKAYGPLRSCRR